MGWQEYPENDDNFLPLTEDELREFQTKTEQVRHFRYADWSSLVKKKECDEIESQNLIS